MVQRPRHPLPLAYHHAFALHTQNAHRGERLERGSDDIAGRPGYRGLNAVPSGPRCRRYLAADLQDDSSESNRATL